MAKPKFQATVTARYLPILLPFVSTEATRYYLNGILFEPYGEGAILVATDGHRLGAIYDKGAKVSDLGIWPLPFRSTRKLMKAYEVDTARFDGRTATFFDGENPVFALPSEKIDGHFPDWRRVFPTKLDGGPTAYYSAQYLADFAAQGHDKVQVVSNGWREPAVVFIARMPEFIGCLMPMVGEEAEPRLPEWLGRKPQAAE